jgi:hypothetical protein
MDAAWVVAALSAAGVIGQLVVGMKNEGRHDEKVRTLGREMGEVKGRLDDHDTTRVRHGRQLVRIETKLNLPPIGE